jgi:outer membrane protein OmpA-like peptidoglycan-associated protein
MQSRTLSKLAIVLATGALIAGCATPQQNNTAAGTGAGAVAGAGLGALFGGGRGAAVGAGLGAVAGGVVGYNWSRIRGDVESSGARDLGVGVAEQSDGSLKVNIPSTVSFDTGSYVVKPELRPVLESVARNLAANPELRAKVVGHTDSTGQAGSNQTLSLNRAGAVANTVSRLGVSPERVTTEGRGQTDPIADNGTVAGRAENRRVEIYLYASK